MHTVKVGLADRSYNIRVGSGLLAGLGKACARLGLGSRCAILTDDQVGPLYADPCVKSLETAGFQVTRITVPAGEKSKRLAVFGQCLDQMAEARLERGSFIVALGGGVVGDLAGYVAASYLRGIDFVQVPTTLLAQVDSSVGGKTGINLKAGKNLVGAFHQPRLVLCDLDTLDTLPAREFRAGMAEVIKYGIIEDARLFRQLEDHMEVLLNRDHELLGRVVARCCRIKADVVGEDEKESGRRAILNFGHTVGHALEAITAYGTFLHGEAISIGQVAASLISEPLAGLPSEVTARVKTLLERTGLPVTTRMTAAQRKRLIGAMSNDKKVRDGQVRFVLATRLGHVEPGYLVDLPTLNQALDAVLDRSAT